MDTTKIHITKLNDDNYQVWKYKIELLLIKEDVWNVIVEDPPVDAAQLQLWNKKDAKARANIGLLIEYNQIIHVKKKVTAKAMWESLKEYHQKSTLSNKVRLLRKLCRMQLVEGGNMQLHLNAMDECIDELLTLGEALGETFAVSLYLSSLPESYNVLTTALESRAEADLTKNMVKNKLLEEYKRRNDQNSNDNEALKVYKQGTTFDKARAYCFFCKKKGHIKADCRKYASWKQKKEASEKANKASTSSDKEETYESLIVSNQQDVNISEWCVDSGASAHMTGEESFFKTLKKSTHQTVKIADGTILQIEGIGVIDFSNKNTNFRLNDVQYVPGLRCNLLSVSKLAENGFNITFKDDHCEIKKNQIVLNVKSRNNVYKVNQEHNNHQAMSILHTDKGKCIHEWHKVLGHRNLADVKKMVNLADNVKIVDCQHNDVCETCLKSKKTRDTFPQKSFTKSSEKLEFIHTDICGPLQISTPRGNYYFLTLIDDYSRYSYVYLIKHKSEVCSKIIEFVEMMKTQYGKVPKVIRSDRGGEYIDNKLRNYLKSKGIKSQFTVPHTPQQNGVAERKNRSLMEMIRCMLASSNLHKQYWGEAVMTANHLLNRLPSKSIKVTPFQLWHEKLPDFSYLRTFGTPVYAYIPKCQRRKLDDTAQKLYFVGYELGTKGYRLLDVETNKVKICRDVIFIETENKENQAIIEFSNDIESENEKPSEERRNEIPDTVSEREQNVRRSSRTNKGIPAKRFIEESNLATKEITDPATYEQAVNSNNTKSWMSTMEEEMEALIKNLYRLKQGAKEWNRKFDKVMKESGYEQCQNDACLYVRKNKDEYISTKKIEPVYCPTNNMVANMLTKPLDGPKLAKHASTIGLVEM